MPLLARAPARPVGACCRLRPASPRLRAAAAAWWAVLRQSGQVGQVVRCMCILSHPVDGTNNAESAQIIVPQKTLKRRNGASTLSPFLCWFAICCFCCNTYAIINCDAVAFTLPYPSPRRWSGGTVVKSPTLNRKIACCHRTMNWD